MKEIKFSLVTIFSLITLLLSSCANSNQQQFDIDLHVENLTPTSVYLEALGINEVTVIDSTTSDSLGNIHFSGHYDEPQLFRIRVQDKGQMFIIIDSEHLKINTNESNLYQYQVAGSSSSQELSKFMQQIYTSNSAIVPLQLEKASLTQNDNIDSLDRAYLDKQIQIETDKLNAFIKSNAEQTKHLNLALFYANFLPINDHGGYLKSFLAQLPTRFEDKKLIEKYKIEFYKHFNKSITEQPIANDQSLLDKQAPAFTMTDMDGTTISLSNFKGNYVLLVFGASWNANSIEWHKAIKLIYNTYKNKNVDIIGIDIETDHAKWSASVSKENLPWAQLSSVKGWECPTALDYKIVSVPTTFLLNPEGKIIGIDLPIIELQEVLKSSAQARVTSDTLTSL